MGALMQKTQARQAGKGQSFTLNARGGGGAGAGGGP